MKRRQTHLGTTPSGRKVYLDRLPADYPNFSVEDHEYAAVLHAANRTPGGVADLHRVAAKKKFQDLSYAPGTKRRAHATMKAGGSRPAKSETRLPDAGAKETKKNVAVMKAFNSKVERLLDQAGAQIAHEWKGEPLGYRQFVLETKAGPLFVSAHGNWVATRFNDPEAAAKLVGTYNLNTYSGKWNHNYFDWPVDEALRDVGHWLKKVAA